MMRPYVSLHLNWWKKPVWFHKPKDLHSEELPRSCSNNKIQNSNHQVTLIYKKIWLDECCSMTLKYIFRKKDYLLNIKATRFNLALHISEMQDRSKTIKHIQSQALPTRIILCHFFSWLNLCEPDKGNRIWNESTSKYRHRDLVHTILGYS